MIDVNCQPQNRLDEVLILSVLHFDLKQLKVVFDVHRQLLRVLFDINHHDQVLSPHQMKLDLIFLSLQLCEL